MPPEPRAPRPPLAWVRRLLALALAASAAPPAVAWGDRGHEIVALIAHDRLSPAARGKVDALLGSDPDPLTAPDFVSRATWADRYRDSDRKTTRLRYEATRAWHYADIELDGGSLGAACPERPSDPAVPASRGPADDCVVRKIDQFAAELRDAATPADERRLALKYLLHFVGDVHQPLHAADRHDAGGNAVKVIYPGVDTASNLHAYWDARLVALLGPDANAVARSIDRSVTAADAARWQRGSAALWATDTHAEARDVAYDLADQPTAADAAGVPCLRLDAAYDARALPVVRRQLAKAGLRLALLLDQAFP